MTKYLITDNDSKQENATGYKFILKKKTGLFTWTELIVANELSTCLDRINLHQSVTPDRKFRVTIKINVSL